MTTGSFATGMEKLEQRDITGQGDIERFFEELGARGGDWPGKRVTATAAIEGTVAVYAAVSLLSETVGSLPLFLYRRVNDRERERISPVRVRWPGNLSRMLHGGPNPEMTAQEYWETVEGHVCLWGNHYSYIVRDEQGRPSELWPLRPDSIEVARRADENGLPVGPRRYVYTLPNGQKRGLLRSEVMHVMDYATDGLIGMSPITVARKAIGVEQAATEYAGRFFSNSSIPGGYLKSPNPLTPQQSTEVKEFWDSSHKGISNAQRVAVLHSGLDWQSVGIPPRDAQFIEVRRFQIEEVARLYRIPLHLLGDTSKESSWGTGIEQMTIGFVVYTLRARLNRIEQAIDRDCADPGAGTQLSDEKLFAEFSLQALLRGDMTTRAEYYSKGINDGWLVPEDARALENLSFIPGIDRPRMPLNQTLIGADGQPMTAEPQPGNEEPEPELEPRSSNGKAARAAYEAALAELGRQTHE